MHGRSTDAPRPNHIQGLPVGGHTSEIDKIISLTVPVAGFSSEVEKLKWFSC